MKVLALSLLLATACASAAGAGGTVRVSVAGKLVPPVAARAWTVRLVVRPASFHGEVHVVATGARRVDVLATGKHGAYRARLVFPSAGRWKLTARAGGTTSRLGTLQVRPAPARPVAFTEPTSIELEPAGTLLLVENNPGRVLRVDPATGRVTVLVPSLARPYAIVRAPSGDVLVSAGNRLLRIGAAGALTTVATADADIGPVAVAPGGDVYFASGERILRLAGGARTPVEVVGTDAGLVNPHGLAVAADGALLVSDTGNNQVRRIDLTTGAITAFAQVGQPRGIDVAADGTISVIDAQANRVVRLTAAGGRIGFLGPTFGVPYDLQIAAGGVTYLLEAGPTGWVRRIAANGTVTTVSRR